MRLIDALVQLQLLLLGQRVVLQSLELLANPVSLFEVDDVHELESDIVGVSVLVGLNQIFELPLIRFLRDSAAERNLELESPFKVGFCEPVSLVVENGVGLFVGAPVFVKHRRDVLVEVLDVQWVQVGVDVAVRHIRAADPEQVDRVFRLHIRTRPACRDTTS